MDILVGAKIICTNGHTVCGFCTADIKKMHNAVCPSCRVRVFGDPIANLVLEGIVSDQYPQPYAERYGQLFGVAPKTWRDEAMFNGTHIQMK